MGQTASDLNTKAEEIAQLSDRVQVSEAEVATSSARAAQLLEEKDASNSSAAAHRGQQAELDASERVAEDLRREVRTLLQEKEAASGRLALRTHAVARCRWRRRLAAASAVGLPASAFGLFDIEPAGAFPGPGPLARRARAPARNMPKSRSPPRFRLP